VCLHAHACVHVCVCHHLQGHRITDDEQWDFEGDFFAREGYACHGEAVVHVVRPHSTAVTGMVWQSITLWCMLAQPDAPSPARDLLFTALPVR
jgi:hypothetical protein